MYQLIIGAAGVATAARDCANGMRPWRRWGMERQRRMEPSEHETKETIQVDCFYPDHAPRVESPTFRHTKSEGHKNGLRCSFGGRQDPEYHHIFLEEAYMNAVDWEIVTGIATGRIDELPVLDPDTDEPTGEMYPVEQSMIWAICKIAEFRGFNWNEFDPSHPETFVDSMANMLPLSEKFHRHKDHGAHMLPGPIWIFQCFPRKGAFVFSPDEEKGGAIK